MAMREACSEVPGMRANSMFVSGQAGRGDGVAVARPTLLLANFGLVLVGLAGLVVVLVVVGRGGERSGRKSREQQGKNGAFHGSVSFQSVVKWFVLPEHSSGRGVAPRLPTGEGKFRKKKRRAWRATRDGCRPARARRRAAWRRLRPGSGPVPRRACRGSRRRGRSAATRATSPHPECPDRRRRRPPRPCHRAGVRSLP